MKKTTSIITFGTLFVLSLSIFTACKNTDPKTESDSTQEQMATSTDSAAILKVAKRYISTSFINPSSIQYIDKNSAVTKVRPDYPYKYRHMNNDDFEQMRDTLSNKWLANIDFDGQNKNDSLKRFSYSILIREKANSLVKKEHYEVIGVKSTEHLQN